jgi:hypothetical protein
VDIKEGKTHLSRLVERAGKGERCRVPTVAFDAPAQGKLATQLSHRKVAGVLAEGLRKAGLPEE